MNIILLGFLGSLCSGLATALGAIPVFFIKKVSDKYMDASLGFAAGIMLAATFFSLLLPSIQTGGVGKAVTGLVFGVLFIMAVEKLTPHLHQVTGVKGLSSRLSKMWLFILAITIHNFPEGMVVGVGFGSADKSLAIPLMIGIGIQNIPEGLAVALALLREGKTAAAAFGIALLTGLVEPIGGLIGVSAMAIAAPLLPYGLAFAAGAMLFVISEEIIPETHSRGNDRAATLGLIAGFIVMMVLDSSFG